MGSIQEFARKKNIRIKLNIEEHYPKFVGDKEHIGMVLGILIDNAISYSMPDLSIEMGAEVQQKQIVFFVTDHGAGISNSEKKRYLSVSIVLTRQGIARSILD